MREWLRWSSDTHLRKTTTVGKTFLAAVLLDARLRCCSVAFGGCYTCGVSSNTWMETRLQGCSALPAVSDEFVQPAESSTTAGWHC